MPTASANTKFAGAAAKLVVTALFTLFTNAYVAEPGVPTSTSTCEDPERALKLRIQKLQMYVLPGTVTRS